MKEPDSIYALINIGLSRKIDRITTNIDLI